MPPTAKQSRTETGSKNEISTLQRNNVQTVTPFSNGWSLFGGVYYTYGGIFSETANGGFYFLPQLAQALGGYRPQSF